MENNTIENLNIFSENRIITPERLKNLYPLNDIIIKNVELGQNTIKNILERKDTRIFAVVGPCSIHDVNAALEYAKRIKKLAKEVEKTIFLVMRVYFEKPRTTVGWQGLVSDPFLDKKNKIEGGLRMARKYLIDINELGVPAAGEALDIVTPQYVQDLISWTAIGARTTESQSHRKMASGFSSAVGFKNGTDGNVEIAINAMKSAVHPNNFISINPNGEVAVVKTKGNNYTHIILRGGNKSPNYDIESIKRTEDKLSEAGLMKNILVDCSHANSRKNYKNQLDVAKEITNMILNGNKSVIWIMLESNLIEGNQKLEGNSENLKYGVSITDACLGWNETEKLLLEMDELLKSKK